MSDKPPTPAARRRARKFALQALYQVHLAGGSASSVIAQFRQDFDMRRADTEYFEEAVAGIVSDKGELNALIEPLLDRGLSELDPVELVVLQIGAWELSRRIDVPYRVVINEGIELARRFGATDSYKYINSVLDKLAQTQSTAERR